jgi:hypothetical protein
MQLQKDVFYKIWFESHNNLMSTNQNDIFEDFSYPLNPPSEDIVFQLNIFHFISIAINSSPEFLCP